MIRIADKVPTDPVPVEDFGGVMEAMESERQRYRKRRYNNQQKK